MLKKLQKETKNLLFGGKNGRELVILSANNSTCIQLLIKYSLLE